MNFKIDLWSSSKAMDDRKKKREGQKYKKFEYLKNEKSFLDETKSIFHNFWRAIIWWKNKNLIKIADTSFKVYFVGELTLVKILWNKIVSFSPIKRLIPRAHRIKRFHTWGRLRVRSFNSLSLHNRLQRNEKLYREN